MKTISKVLLTITPNPVKRGTRGAKNSVRLFCDYGYLYINHSTYSYADIYFNSLDKYDLELDVDTKTLKYTKEGKSYNIKFFDPEDFYYCRGCLCNFETN